jgi:GT2 family glycosyltransferase
LKAQQFFDEGAAAFGVTDLGMGQISVIVLSWNAREYLRNCLASIRETRGSVVREVIVVDNASHDGSPDMVAAEFPEVILVRSMENLGFARANNLGMRHSTGSLLALVNSDVIVHRDCFQRLAAFLAYHPEVGLVGPKVFGSDGRVQSTCGRLPTFSNTACEFLLLYKLLPRWSAFSGFQERHLDGQKHEPVEVLSGCFWVARRTAVAEVGGLDERFFFYAEDLDWCKRFKNAGWKLMFVPEATATHFGGASSSHAPLRYSIVYLQANLIYWKKHHGRLGWSVYWVLATAQHSLRFLIRLLMRLTSPKASGRTEHKLAQHLACLRWLLTGRSI